MYGVMGEAMENREAVERVVQEHGRWVLGAARRRVGDAELAEDVAQGVFLLYWRKGAVVEGMSGEGKLAGWLYRAVRYCSANAMRLKRIRQRHERVAAMERKQTERTAGWMEVEGELEGAMDGLSEKDRQAVVLRFYRGLSLKQVGVAMGMEEEAARKRVERAVGKLRERLAGKGVVVEAGSLGAMVLAHAVECGMEGGSAGLVEKVMAGIGGGGGNGTAGLIAKGAEKMMVWAKVKVAAVMIGAVLVTGGVTAVAAGTTPVPAGPASKEPEATTAKDAAWQAKFNRVYGLADGEVVKRIRPPFPPERTEFWKANDRKKRDAPDQMVLLSGGQFTFASRGWGQVDPLKSVLQSVMGWNTGDFEGPADLLAKPVPGDWVVRAGATEQEKVAGLLAILQRDVDPAITIEKQQQAARETIVARGKFEYQPHVDASGTNQVILFSDPYVAEDGGGGGAGTLAQFLNVMGNCAGVQVVDQVDRDRPAMVSWHTLGSCWLSARPKDPDRSKKLDSLLKNVAAQTGLSLIREKQKASVWVVGWKVK